MAHGLQRPMALDLIPVFHEMNLMGLVRDDYDSLLVDVKAMAAEALVEVRVE